MSYPESPDGGIPSPADDPAAYRAWLEALRQNFIDRLLPDVAAHEARMQEAARLERERALAHAADATVITEVIGLGELHFTNSAGVPTPQHEPVRSPSTQLLDDLLTITVELGEGEHGIQRAAVALGKSVIKTEESVSKLSELLPPGLFDHIHRGSIWTSVRIGNVALAARQATPAELEGLAERQRQAAIAARQAKRERIDRGKAEMSSHDHAVVEIGGRQFLMHTDRANTILAARILHLLAHTTGMTHLHGNVISDAVWHDMTYSERALFARKEADLFRHKGTIIHKYAMDIMRQLMSPLLATRETTQEYFKLENPVTITFNNMPPSAEAAAKLVPIFPPGTPREQVMDAGDKIPDAAFTEADILLDIASDEAVVNPDETSAAPKPFCRINRSGDTELAQDYARGLLILTADRNVKRAISIRLATTGKTTDINDIIRHIRSRIEATLLEGYESAMRECMIGGYAAHGAHGGVRHVSGELPIRTQTVDIIKKWRIGRPAPRS